MKPSPVFDLSDHKPQKRCHGCPFGGPKVGSKGDPDAKIVFVAESPGIEEVKKGEPLVGMSGRIFHEFVPEDGSIYILNALECRPLAALKQEPRMNLATGCCQNRVIDKISRAPRRIVVAMGNAAVRSLTGNMGLKITQIRGRLIPSPLAELGILPVVHIAALMRGTGSYRQWKQDMQYAMDLGLGADPIQHIPTKVKIWPEGWMALTRRTEQEAIDELFRRMPKQLTADIETTGFDHINDRILSIGITPDDDPSISYCFWPRHLPLLKKHLEDRSIKWCWHNGKFDVKFLRRAGVYAYVDDDTMLLSYALDEMGGVHGLEVVSKDVLGAPDYKYMVQEYLPNKDSSYELIPKPILAAYQAIDTGNTSQIRSIYRQRVKRDPALEKLYTQTLIPASEMLAWVEDNGICTDPQRLEDNEGYFADMKAEIGQEIQELVGYPINAGSPKQVKELLFRRMKFPNRKKGSTDKDVLKALQQKTEHPIFALILKHRKAVKMYGTYVKGIKKHVHEDTQRIHASVLIHGTRTGRLAVRDPNLQNPPRLPQIRGTFVASPGHELIEVDLSQAELRSLAALSGDPTLCDVFLSGRSPHKDLSIHLSSVGSFEPDWEERYAKHSADPENPLWLLAKEEYTKSKNVNFGIMYGITAFGLMGEINDTRMVAQEMLDEWSVRYPVATEFINKCRATPMRNQIITTCFGRKKRVGVVSKANLSFLKNEAANFPHQSIASDITLHAAIRIWQQLKAWDVRIVNLIHDSILMESPITPQNETRGKVIDLVSREMQQVPIDWGIKRVPFLTDAEVGHRWGSLMDPEVWDKKQLEEAA